MEGPRHDPCLGARRAGKDVRQPGPFVTDFSTAIAGLVAEPRFIAAVLVTALAGIVRGFSGFGSALIYIPLVSAIYEPRIGVVTLLLIDFVCGAPFAVREARRCDWSQLLPVLLAAVICIPVGTLALQYADPVVLRWIMAALVAVLLAVLASGWRYSVTPRLPYSLAAGAASGLGAGAERQAAARARDPLGADQGDDLGQPGRQRPVVQRRPVPQLQGR